jgi:hypothetical protein
LIGLLPVLTLLPLLAAHPLPWVGLPAAVEGALFVGVPISLAAALAEILLVSGVRRERHGGGESGSWSGTLRRHWRPVATVVLVGVLLSSVTVLAFEVPGWLTAAGLSPLAVGAIVVLLLLPVVAYEVTRTAWVSFAVRHVVVEDARGTVAIVRAWRFLHGRLHLALKLYLATSLLGLAGAAVTGALMVVLMMSSFAVGLGSGMGAPAWVPLVIAFALSLPAICLARALASALWTLSFLDERALR